MYIVELSVRAQDFLEKLDKDKEAEECLKKREKYK